METIELAMCNARTTDEGIVTEVCGIASAPMTSLEDGLENIWAQWTAQGAKR